MVCCGSCDKGNCLISGAYNPNRSRLPAADLGSAIDAPAGCPMHVKEKPTIDAIRGTFQRMGFTDRLSGFASCNAPRFPWLLHIACSWHGSLICRETVCLIILGHQYGRCHLNVSGFEHPWYAFDPTHWNVYGPGGLGYISLYPFAVASNQMRQVTTAKGKRQVIFSTPGGKCITPTQFPC